MPLKVLSVAFPFAPVGPHCVGGAEQILAALDRALVAAGHTSTVIACEGSQTAGTLIPIAIPAVLDQPSQAACKARLQAALHRVVLSDTPDLVHMHGFDFHQYSLPEHIPILVTLHLPIDWYPASSWTPNRGNLQFCCVSHSQRLSCPPEMNSAIVIENGVDLPSLSPQRSRGHFALLLGRICPEKNQHEALLAGTRAGIPVVLAGQVFPYPEHQRYFEQKVAPLLASTHGIQHRFLGPIDPPQRNRLLAEAKCLLHPTLAPETSSLVAMEALAAGTPVIAYASGALPEIVDDGVTGFLVDGVEQMAEALLKVHTISPQTCRTAAEQRFDKACMVQRYFNVYQWLVRAARPEILHA